MRAMAFVPKRVQVQVCQSKKITIETAVINSHSCSEQHPPPQATPTDCVHTVHEEREVAMRLAEELWTALLSASCKEIYIEN